MLSGSAEEDVPSGQSYEALYVEHAPAARRLARSLVPPDVAEDIVAEAFTRVLGAIRAGGGPSEAFRGYLFTAVRNLANDWLRATRRVAAIGDLEAGGWTAERSGAISHLSSGAEVQAEARAEARLVARAFARLPVRWRAVLWQLEVEGNSPAAVARLFGLSANGVSALAVRAREGLRQAYLQEHIGANIPVPCRAFAEVLGAGARGRLSRRRRAAVHEHLGQCPACTDLFAELSELNSRLGAILAPVVLAGSSAAAASAAASAAPAATSAASGVTSAAAAVGRHVLFRAGLAGPARLWRLHPATGVASVAAGVAAAGGMIIAVSISPAVVSPSPAGPRPATSITVSGNFAGEGAHGGAPSPGPAVPLARAARSAATAVAGCVGNQAQASAGRGDAGRNRPDPGSAAGNGTGSSTGSSAGGSAGDGTASNAASAGACAAAGGVATVGALPGGIVAVQAPAAGGRTGSRPVGPIRQVAKGLGDALASTTGNLGRAVANAAQALGSVLGNTAGGAGSIVGGATGKLGGVVGGVTKNLQGVVGSTTKGLGGLAGHGTGALGGAGRPRN